MGKYQKRIEIVDAFKWTGGEDQTEDPEWFTEIINGGYVWFEWQAKREIFRMHIVFPHLGQDYFVYPGSYIVTNHIGMFQVMAEDEFEATYQPVEEKSRVLTKEEIDAMLKGDLERLRFEAFGYPNPAKQTDEYIKNRQLNKNDGWKVGDIECDVSIEELCLPNGLMRALQKTESYWDDNKGYVYTYAVKTIGQILNLEGKKLRKADGFGPVGLRVLRQKLEDHGFASLCPPTHWVNNGIPFGRIK